jgi:hypothetical protein
MIGRMPQVPIVGLGAGPHAKALLEAIRSRDRFEVAAVARAGG